MTRLLPVGWATGYCCRARQKEETGEREKKERVRARGFLAGEEKRSASGERRKKPEVEMAPVNRRALSQSRKTAKLHLPF